MNKNSIGPLIVTSDSWIKIEFSKYIVARVAIVELIEMQCPITPTHHNFCTKLKTVTEPIANYLALHIGGYISHLPSSTTYRSNFCSCVITIVLSGITGGTNCDKNHPTDSSLFIRTGRRLLASALVEPWSTAK